MRLYNYLKNTLFLTRAELSCYLEGKKVLVDGKEAKLSYNLNLNQRITIDGKELQHPPFVYYLYNKPRGVLSSNLQEKKNSYLNFLSLGSRVFIVGRLDVESEGLMILTNDGEFANSITNKTSHVEKEYVVTLENEITPLFMENIVKPILVKNKPTESPIVFRIDDYSLRIVLHEGKYHEIRTMVIKASNRVKNLKRIRIGPYLLGDLKENEIRKITI